MFLKTEHIELSTQTYLKIIKMSLLLTSSLFFYESAYAENEVSNKNACPTRPKSQRIVGKKIGMF